MVLVTNHMVVEMLFFCTRRPYNKAYPKRKKKAKKKGKRNEDVAFVYILGQIVSNFLLPLPSFDKKQDCYHL